MMSGFIAREILSSFRWVALVAPLMLLSGCGGSSRSSLPDFSDLVRRVSPSVVNISASSTANAGGARQQQRVPQSGSPSDTPAWLRKYLARRQGAGKPPDSAKESGDDITGSNRTGDVPLHSLGSGFILSTDGYILTDDHVIERAEKVVVGLSDGRQLKARIVGVDPRSDLALLKINAHGLPAAKIADVRKLKVGQWVLAIGSPFGFNHTATSGIVSAVNRNLETNQYIPFIQTDAAVNPGDSGGPLFNLQGQVIGVNSQIYSETGGFMGLAFAVPINVAVKVANQLKATGRVRRGWLGVIVQQVTPKLAASFGLTIPHGALITHVLSGSPAEQSGLKAGDVILSFNGTELHSSRDLPPLVGNCDPDQTVPLKLLRNRKIVMLEVQLGSLSKEPSDRTVAQGVPGQKKASPEAPDLGLSLQSLQSQQPVDGQTGAGLLVTGVVAGAARDAGVQTGDILLSLAGEPLSSPAKFQQIVRELTPGRTVPLLVQRPSGPLFLALTVPASQ